MLSFRSTPIAVRCFVIPSLGGIPQKAKAYKTPPYGGVNKTMCIRASMRLPQSWVQKHDSFREAIFRKLKRPENFYRRRT